jgi:hypothetical protein
VLLDATRTYRLGYPLVMQCLPRLLSLPETRAPLSVMRRRSLSISEPIRLILMTAAAHGEEEDASSGEVPVIHK